MTAPRQLFRSMSTLALLLTLLCLSFVKINASSSGGSEQEKDSPVSSSSSYYAPQLNPSNDDDDRTRTIQLWGVLPATYVGKVAEFGNSLSEPMAANLMVPPDDPFLCTFPESFQNITSSSSSPSLSTFMDSNIPLPYKIALFVSLEGGCSAEQKARVALEIRQRVTPRLELLILYSPIMDDNNNDNNNRNNNNNDNNNNEISNEEELVSLQLDPESSWHNDLLNLDGQNNLGILHVPQRYAIGIEVRIRINANNSLGSSRNSNNNIADPRMGMPTNEDWKLEVAIAPLGDYQHGGGGTGTGGYHPTGFSGGSGGSRGYHDNDDLNDGTMYFFRIVLFTLLIVSPCCRAGYLWHAGGGRFHWRRNDNGRIVGILYVPPIPAWLSTGSMQPQQDTRTGKLTMEQFNTLPEIKYMPNGNSDHDNDDDDDDENNNSDCDDGDAVNENNTAAASQEEEEDVNTSKTKKKKKAVKKTDSNGGESSSLSDDDFPSLKQNSTEDTETESMETTVEIAPAPATSTSSCHESIEDALELGDAVAAAELKDKEQEAAKDSVPEAAASETDSANNNVLNNSAPDACPESCNQASCPTNFIATTSSMCSICIDDFDAGESLILLPRCQHAFHKDCILPWLTERQGCCPMCKCSVLEEEEQEEVEVEEGGRQQDQSGGNVNDISISNESSENELAPPQPAPRQSRRRR